MITRHATHRAAFASPDYRIGLIELGRQFTGTSVSVVTVKGNMHMRQMGHIQAAWRGFRSIILILMGV